MSPQHDEAEIAAFIRSKGVTRCPTACAVPTQACGNEDDRLLLRKRAEWRQAARDEKIQKMRHRLSARPAVAQL